nr:Putative DNA-binding protein [Kibdelosporangium sp. MJ126-NF4]
MVRLYVGFELQRLREAAGKSQPEAGKAIDTSKAKISHFESGRNLPSLLEAEALLKFYGAPHLVDVIADLIVQAREAKSTFDLNPDLELAPGFSLYVGVEQGASTVFTYDATLFMGILHSRRYAEATVRGVLGEAVSDDHVAGLVDLRMRRQVALDRADNPLHVTAVINQGVLHQQFGGVDVAAEQLDYLLTMAERDNVSLRVLPFSAGAHPAVHGPFTRLEFPVPGDFGLVYTEDLTGGRFHDDTGVVDRYTQAGARLLELALSEGQSLSMIRTARKEMTR